ncbi:hypothetical protein WJX82_002214 [Trebouxia sp. C0006]
MPWPVRETDVWQRTSIQSLPSTALGKRWCRRHPTSCILVRHPRRQLTMGLPSAHKVEVHNPAAGRALPQPPLEVIDDEPEWEVDRILDHTVIKHKKASKCMLEATAARNTVADPASVWQLISIMPTARRYVDEQVMPTRSLC